MSSIKTSITTTTITDGKKEVILKTFPATLHYAHLKNVATKGEYPSMAYEAILQVSPEYAKKLAALEVQVNTKSDKPELGTFVRAKSKKIQPAVFDEKGRKFASNVNDEKNPERGNINEVPLVENGSTAEVTVAIYPNREANVRAGRGGKMALGLREIRFTKLIEYIPPNQAEPL